MPFEPQDAIAEILGRTAVLNVSPENSSFICPHIEKPCTKRSTKLDDEPYPVCSLWKPLKTDTGISREVICVCPKRFYQVDWLNAVVENCWPFDPPADPVVATEVKMTGFGNVDFVIADKKDDGTVGNFLSVELQAIDITGSVFPAYQALRQGHSLPKRPTYGFNWDNVYKRYITQLVRKGYFHHHWGTKIVAVIQDQVYDYVIKKAAFMRSSDVRNPNVNIIFMTYTFEADPSNPGQLAPVLKRVEGTSHASLQQAILYKEAPSLDEFKEKISVALTRFD